MNTPDSGDYDPADWDDIRNDSRHALWRASAEHRFWRDRLNDPDNWMNIPEFGVMPKAADFEGFQFPIFAPFEKHRAESIHETEFWVRANVYEVVRELRKLARKRFDSLASLEKANQRLCDSALFDSDPWDEDDGRRPGPPPSADEVWAFDYKSMFWDLRDVIFDVRTSPRSAMAAMGSALRTTVLMAASTDPTEVRRARRDFARAGADSRHEPNRRAMEYVQTEWRVHAIDYEMNKSAFARDYVKLVAQRFCDTKRDPLLITEKTIKEVWLRDAPSASKPAG